MVVCPSTLPVTSFDTTTRYGKGGGWEGGTADIEKDKSVDGQKESGKLTEAIDRKEKETHRNT